MTSTGQGWTLIARFSNDDAKNWMDNTGHWWYDKRNAAGYTRDPSINADMMSPAFWAVRGSELKITRSDDSQHTPLLQTAGNCLGGQTFRSKVTSYGNFRNGAVGLQTGAWGLALYNRRAIRINWRFPAGDMQWKHTRLQGNRVLV